MTLKGNTTTSFYLNDELIDTVMLAYQGRLPNGGRNHKRNTALAKLTLLAHYLNDNQIYEDNEDNIRQWIEESNG
jgi:hypothetical protein